MTITTVMAEMNRITPPFQPELAAGTEGYQQRLVEWNPMCVKRNALFYQFTTDEYGGSAALIPDACLNVLFRCDSRSPGALLSGIRLEASEIALAPNTTYFGFKPYTCLGMKSGAVGYAALTGFQTDFDSAYPEAGELMEQITTAEGFDVRVRRFMQYAQRHLINPDYIPSFVDYFAVMICASRGNLTFSRMEEDTGYSERYCRERFKYAYGISPKRYSGVMRFQHAAKELVRREYDDFSSLAFDCGYFDQAHLIHDFKRFSGMTPHQFRQNCLRTRHVTQSPAAPLLACAL